MNYFISKKIIKNKGSSLVVTLLVVTILTIIVIAFLQSMRIERTTSYSYRSIEVAKQAAESGVNEAITVVRKTILDFPDTSSFWETNMAVDALRTPGTALFSLPPAPATGINIAGPINYRPLISGASSVGIDFDGAGKAAAWPSDAETVNINTAGFSGSDKKWVGLFPPGSPTSTNNPESSIDVPWVELRDSDNKVVARFAWWVEDETFKVNLNEGSADPRGNNSMGSNPTEISLTALLEQIGSKPQAGESATSIKNLQGDLGGDLMRVDHVNHIQNFPSDVATGLEMFTTIHSEGSALSRTGSRRLNLNTLVQASPNEPTAIRTEIDKMILAIKNQAPNFGQRFFRRPPLSAANINELFVTSSTDASNLPRSTEAYLTKIATNIRDYISPSFTPTKVRTNGTIAFDNSEPVISPALGGQVNPFLAVGKTPVPRLVQTMKRVKQVGSMGSPGASTSNYDIRISYYLQFWNPTNRDITITDLSLVKSPLNAREAYVAISNQPSWIDAGDNSTKIPEDPARDIKIRLREFRNAAGNEVIFRAGTFTTLTTDPGASSLVGTASSNILRTADLANLYVANEERRFTGTLGSNSRTGYGGRPTLLMRTRDLATVSPTSNTGADFETEVVLGNGAGYLDWYVGALPLAPSIFVDSFGSKNNTTLFHLRGGVIPGNKSYAEYWTGGSGSAQTYPGGGEMQVGDPLAFNEPVRFAGNTAFNNQRHRFMSWRGTANNSSEDTGQRSTFTEIRPFNWNGNLFSIADLPEASANIFSPPASGGAPYFMRNEPVVSIGELGHIYDPRRIITAATTGVILNSKGGGRTLRIGRTEGGEFLNFPVWDGNHNSNSRTWTAWRLVDIFSTSDEISLPGAINPNGFFRDGGIAMRAAFQDMEGLTAASSNGESDAEIAGKSFTSDEINDFTSSLQDYLNEGLPLFERGELSEISFFEDGSLGSANFSDLSDRGREEIFRRMVELISTRGNVFTVYVVGQDIRSLPDGTKQVGATYSEKVTFQILPEFVSESLDFNPSQPSSVADRFASPSNYRIQILERQN